MTIKYHSELENSCIDALFWKNQNNPDEKNEQIFHWFQQLLKSTSVNLSDNEKDEIKAVLIIIIIITFIVMISIFTNKHNRIKWLWIFSAYDDKDYIKAWQTIKKEAR